MKMYDYPLKMDFGTYSTGLDRDEATFHPESVDIIFLFLHVLGTHWKLQWSTSTHKPQPYLFMEK